MEFIHFLPEELMILVVAINILGSILKSLEFVPDKYIVIILLTFGIIVALTRDWSMNSVLFGIIATGVAVLGNQTVKQLRKK